MDDIFDNPIILRLAIRIVDERIKLFTTNLLVRQRYNLSDWNSRKALVTAYALMIETAENMGERLVPEDEEISAETIYSYWLSFVAYDLRKTKSSKLRVVRTKGTMALKLNHLHELGWTANGGWPSEPWEDQLLKDVMQPCKEEYSSSSGIETSRKRQALSQDSEGRDTKRLRSSSHARSDSMGSSVTEVKSDSRSEKQRVAAKPLSRESVEANANEEDSKSPSLNPSTSLGDEAQDVAGSVPNGAIAKASDWLDRPFHSAFSTAEAWNESSRHGIPGAAPSHGSTIIDEPFPSPYTGKHEQEQDSMLGAVLLSDASDMQDPSRIFTEADETTIQQPPRSPGTSNFNLDSHVRGVSEPCQDTFIAGNASPGGMEKAPFVQGADAPGMVASLRAWITGQRRAPSEVQRAVSQPTNRAESVQSNGLPTEHSRIHEADAHASDIIVPLQSHNAGAMQSATSPSHDSGVQTSMLKSPPGAEAGFAGKLHDPWARSTSMVDNPDGVQLTTLWNDSNEGWNEEEVPRTHAYTERRAQVTGLQKTEAAPTETASRPQSVDPPNSDQREADAIASKVWWTTSAPAMSTVRQHVAAVPDDEAELAPTDIANSDILKRWVSICDQIKNSAKSFVKTLVRKARNMRLDASGNQAVEEALSKVCRDKVQIKDAIWVQVPALLAFLVYDRVLSKEQQIYPIDMRDTIDETARDFGIDPKEFAAQFAFNRIQNRSYQNEDLTLMARRLAREMAELLRHGIYAVNEDARPSPEDLRRTVGQEGDFRAALGRLQADLETILHTSLIVRTRIDVSPREFELFWANLQLDPSFPSEEVMNWDDDQPEGQQKMQAAMFPALQVRKKDGSCEIICKAAVCVE